MTLAFLRNALLRTAITLNLVSFPSQIRPFSKRTVADLQVRIVQLYFVQGWSVGSICNRYRLPTYTVHKLLGQWRTRAIESGCIQEIEPGILAAIVPEAQDVDDTDYVDTPPVFNRGTRAESAGIVYAAVPALTHPPERPSSFPREDAIRQAVPQEAF
jgi:hypothetical protein